MKFTITNLCYRGLFEMNLFINDNTANCDGCAQGTPCYQFLGGAYVSNCINNGSQCCCQGGDNAVCVYCNTNILPGSTINCSCTGCTIILE